MKALTLTQPWATLMVLGAKRIETRSWSTSYRGPLAIHAAKSMPREARELCHARRIQELLGWHTPVSDVQARIRTLPFGAVIGICNVVQCLNVDLIRRFVQPFTEQEELLGNYDPGRFGWLTDGMVPLPEPIPAKGALSLWEWTHPSEGSDQPQEAS